jgi:type IV secretory pathway TraG/TraD family ATPase VirD4
MQDSVRGTMAERYLDEGATQMSQSLLATLTSQLESFTLLRDVRDGEDAFSIKSFIQDEASDRWLFISMRSGDDAIQPLVSMWFDTAIKAALSLPDVDQKAPVETHRRLFFVLDELARLQVLPTLGAALETGRSKGVSCILGLQSFEDVKETYGDHAAKAIIGMPQTALVCRTTEGDTAAWLQEQLGRAEVEQGA